MDFDYLVYFIFLIRFLSLRLNRFHSLIVLLRIEFIILILHLILILFLNIYVLEMYFIIIFSILRVCEGVLGLSILIYIIRLHGND